jgi:Glyoxalase-like domain
MRLDHVSYVASHDQISDVVNRIGSQLGTSFVDGGIHPKFGTRNFTAPLLNKQYIEVVCPLDHPATDATPFGKSVKKKAEEGGGWLAWVIETESIEVIEEGLNRKAVLSSRIKPDGTKLEWYQIGVDDVLSNIKTNFFIKWISSNHPSADGTAKAILKNFEIVSLGKTTQVIAEELNMEIDNLLNSNAEISAPNYSIEIQSVTFELDKNSITIF